MAAAGAAAAAGDKIEGQHCGGSLHGLFEGKKLWFSRAVPQRAWLMRNAEIHGAQIVHLEQQADIKLVDHLKRNQAPGTHSYRYVEISLQNGVLEDLDTYRVGSASRVDRLVGSVVTAGKGSRNKFTDSEDQMLWDWVKPHMDAGGSWKGFEIYKQLESQYPNHTFQSWRDRWIKHTQYQKRKITSQEADSNNAIYNQGEESSRLPKQRKIGQRQQQSADIGIVQHSLTHVSAQNQPLRRAAHEQVMGNSGSSQTVSQNVVQTPKPCEQVHEANSTCDDVEEKNFVAQSARAHEEPEREFGVQVQKKINYPNSSEVREHSVKMARRAIENQVRAVSNDHKDTRAADVDDAESSVSVDDKRLPLAYNFTQEEACMLYKATCHILDARSDKLDESWTGVAKEYGHTKEAWQTFFYEFIVPEYKKRHGIATDAELEAHYKEQLKERREFKASVAQKRDFEPEKDMTEMSQQVSNTMQAAADDNLCGPLPKNSDKAENASETRIDQAHDHCPVSSEESSKVQKPLPPGALVDNHPPKPNESRKLSQTKGSQSVPSQSTSMVSQPSQHLQSSNRIATTPEQAASIVTNIVSKHKPGIPPRGTEASEIHQTLAVPNTEEAFSNEQNKASTLVLSQVLPAPQLFGGREEHSGRFVTQVSRDGQPTSTESAEAIHEDLSRSAMSVEPNYILISSESVPKELMLPSQSISGIEAGSQSDKTSNDLDIRLIEGDDRHSDSPHSSEYASSEVLSEDVTFESQIKLSQGWETAPEERSIMVLKEEIDKTQADGEKTNVANADGHRAFGSPHTSAVDHMVSNRQHRVSIVKKNTQDDKGTTDELNTESGTPMAFLNRQNDACTNSRPDSDNRIDTQALFKRSIPESLVDRFTIPEPPGGWADEVQASTLGMTDGSKAHDSEGTGKQEIADWMLLPEPDTDHAATASFAPEDDNEPNIGSWLTEQSRIYTSVPPTLLKPLSHRALESTSMDLDLASNVLSHMIDRFGKGKHPATLSIKDIKKLPRQERKSVISKIVSDLLPSHMSGCWTAGDDAALLGVNGREVKRVEDKHGENNVRNRFEFLEMWHSR